jgi:cyclopropane fatty-acyl-phospholipid synthase-like methyltransferase
MRFFDRFPEFVEQDNRATRAFAPVTKESLTNRCMAFMPDVQGKSVLDLGSGLGAMGMWAMAHCATFYTGVEVQPEYADRSEQLLAMQLNANTFQVARQDVRAFLELNPKQYDIVLACGIINAFIDPFAILKLIAEASSKEVVIDAMYPWGTADQGIALIEICEDAQIINVATANRSDQYFKATGTRLTPTALKVIMKGLGFGYSEPLMPAPNTDKRVHDAYHDPLERDTTSTVPFRYALRFVRTGSHLRELAQVVALATDTPITYATPPRIAGTWAFDAAVADRFQREALAHIPDYERVIDMSIDILDCTLQGAGRVLDVGSAIGYTVGRLIDAGYDAYGVEASAAMADKSQHTERIILSDSFPAQSWAAVLANWTLHFIPEREAYLAAIHDHLIDNGVLVLTDKMDCENLANSLYLDFKRNAGVSDAEIAEKVNAIKGVLTVRPLTWYLAVLNRIGFREVQVMNARFGFVTLVARK